jgi:biotin operon repressor
MSYKATNWAYEMRITGPAKPVLVALADMADEDASCYPGQEKLSAMTGLSVSTVARALQRLEDLGLLVRQHRYGSRGYRTSDRYRLQLTVDIPETLPVTAPTRQRAYKAESESLPVTVQSPTRHSDGAEENHQLEPPVKPSGGARVRAKTPQPVDNSRPDLFCDAHMPDGPGMTKCPQCGDRRRSRADWDRRNTKPTPIPPRDLVDPESCDHKFVGGWCVWCPTPQVVLV